MCKLCLFAFLIFTPIFSFSATLPSGYTELEYLTADASSYIEDVNFTTISSGKIEIKTSNLHMISRFVGWGSNNSTSVVLATPDSKTNFFPYCYGYNWVNNTAASLDITGLNTIVYEFENGNQKLYINGNLDKESTLSASLNTDTFKLFNGMGYNKLVTIYYCKVYNGNGDLLREYIPAKDSNNVLGMYETRTGRFLTNAGSGTFTAGPEVLPDEYTRLEYIESNGKQRIDTGIVPENSLVSIDFDVQYTDISKENYFIQIKDLGYVGSGVAVGLYNGSWCMILPGTNWNTFAPASQDRIQANWTIDGNNGTARLSGDLSHSSTSLSHFGNDLPWRDDTIYLVGHPGTTHAQLKFYSTKIRLDNNLFFNGIPAQRKSDCAVGVYDTVSGTFFTSETAHDFIAPSTNICVPSCETISIMGTEMCPEITAPVEPYLTARYNNNTYYIKLSENDYPLHVGSSNKLQIITNTGTYNAHDDSVTE